MNILLLGANGQLGTDILKANESLIKPFHITKLTRNELDVTQLNQIQDILRRYDFDVLINTIGFTNTELAEKDPHTAFKINASCVKEFATIAQEKKGRLVQISTDFIFGKRNHSLPLKENEPPFPLNIYGCSKLMAENIIQHNLDNFLIFRVSSLFGTAGASGKGGNFVESIIRNAKVLPQLKVVDDQVMSPTSTLDLAHIILKSLLIDVPSGIYNAVNSGQASWFSFAKEIIDQLELSAEINPIKTSEHSSSIARPAFSVLDNSKISEYVGDIRSWKESLNNYLIHKTHIN